MSIKLGTIDLAGTVSDTTKADKDNVLELDGTTAFTPTADYQPATKKYVDDNVGGGGGISDVFKVYTSVNYAMTTSSTIIPFNTEIIDSGNNFDIVTYKYTAPTNGTYFFGFNMVGASFTASDLYYVQIYKNATAITIGIANAKGTTRENFSETTPIELLAGDTVELRAYNSTAARGSLIKSSGINTIFYGYKLN